MAMLMPFIAVRTEIHKAPCKYCPSAHFEPDPEMESIKNLYTREEQRRTLFVCAWRPGLLCKGVCDYLGFTERDLMNATSSADFRRYIIKDKEASWGIFVIDLSNGYFSAITDWGDYCYLWSSIGSRDFRDFLAGLNADYLHGKIMSGRPDRQVYDDEATLHAVKERLQTLCLKKDVDGFNLDEEKERLEDNSDLIEEPEFNEWCRETKVPEPWLLKCVKNNPQSWAFCAKLYPIFAKLLKEELEAEKKTKVVEQQPTP